MTPRPVPLTRRILNAALCMAPLLVPCGAAPAGAIEQGPYTMEVLVDGRPLAELCGRGRTYVQAIAGREYSLRLTNHTGQRVAMAVAVDGLNSIDAKTTSAGEGSKWILGPYETITLSGWQTSSRVARRFFFTTETASYGAWLGKTDNLGVISTVVFRERVPVPIVEDDSRLLPQRRYDEPAGSGAAEPMQKSKPSAAAPAPSEKRAEASGSLQAPVPSPALSDEYAATGIGRKVDHRVERVAFDAEPTPAASLELRYEYRDALVKLGLLHRRPMNPLDRREHAHGFQEPGFAPDPYGQRQ